MNSECAVCKCPLGQESKDLGWIVCHEHRTCSICSKEVTPLEAKHCLEYEKDIQHARCETLQKSRASLTVPGEAVIQLTQETFDRLNLARLMIDPDMTVSQDTNEQTAMLMAEKYVFNMSLEEKFFHLHKMEACVAAISIAIRRDPKAKMLRENLEKLDKERKKAETQALTSSRPNNKPETDEKEIALAEFMRLNGITERKVGQQLWRDRAKAIQALITVGIPEVLAQASVDGDMQKKGLLRKTQ